MPASKSAFPRVLRDKVLSMMFMFLEQKRFWTLFGIGFRVFMLFEPLVGRPDHNGCRYLIAPLVCPIGPALYFIFRPFDPTRGPAARLSGMVDRDRSDQDAKRLGEVLGSQEARKFIWRTTAMISGALFAVMAIVAITFRNSLNGLFPSPWLGQGLVAVALDRL